MRHVKCSFPAAALAFFLLLPAAGTPAQQAMSPQERDADLQMLHDAKQAIQKYYYDPKIHGLDLDALFAQFQARIQSSTSNHSAFASIAGFVESLNDTHTHFYPPDRVGQFDYGFGLQIVGDKCFVSRVRPGSDAESKLHPGDQVILREGVSITRANFFETMYYFNSLSPMPVSRLVVIDPTGTSRNVQVMSKTWTQAKVLDLTGASGFAIYERIQNREIQMDESADMQYKEQGDVMILKIPEFVADRNNIETAFGMARKHKTLILDLRGDPGGAVESLQDTLAFLFDHDVKIADVVARKPQKPMTVKSVGSYAFSGKLIVLVDSGSASAAELLARVVQLEQRGTLIGDRTAGAVMEAKYYPYQQGVDSVIPYAFEITFADLLMKDGKSLEHVGVTPDEIMTPSASDLAEGKDPVLAHAAQLAGWNLSPEDAGNIFPYRWTPLSLE